MAHDKVYAICENMCMEETMTKEQIEDLYEYSTEEKVVGTWIDGKPIYKKTFDITSGMQNHSQDGLTVYDYPITSLGIDMPVRLVQSIIHTNTWGFTSTPIHVFGNGGAVCNVSFTKDYIRFTTGNMQNIGNENFRLIATILYTKTTD